MILLPAYLLELCCEFRGTDQTLRLQVVLEFSHDCFDDFADGNEEGCNNAVSDLNGDCAITCFAGLDQSHVVTQIIIFS
jgi:hypothetical protein